MRRSPLFPVNRPPRRRVRLAVLAAVLWMLASAAHFHPLDAHAGGGQPVPDCALCLSLPGSAPLPARAELPARTWTRVAPVGFPAARQTSPGRLSAYLSQGPPAA